MTNTRLNQNQLEDNNFNYGMNRQAIINGNFDVWQRGTSVAMTAANAYTADRWYCDTATAGDDKTVSQQTADVNGSRYSCRVQRVNGETGHTVLRLSQALESQDSIKLRGNKLTLSFYLKVGANFSAASSILTAKILTGKGTDEKATTFTTSADAISSDITATTTSVKYILTTTNVIAADITQIGVSFSYDPTGTAGANDWFEITQVQLCAGDVALPFMPKSFEEELRACQRYYEKSFLYTTTPVDLGSYQNGISELCIGANVSTTEINGVFYFKVVKRIAPIIVFYNAQGSTSAGRLATYDGDDHLDLVASYFAIDNKVCIDVTATSLTAGKGTLIIGNLTASAEL